MKNSFPQIFFYRLGIVFFVIGGIVGIDAEFDYRRQIAMSLAILAGLALIGIGVIAGLLCKLRKELL